MLGRPRGASSAGGGGYIGDGYIGEENTGEGYVREVPLCLVWEFGDELLVKGDPKLPQGVGVWG